MWAEPLRRSPDAAMFSSDKTKPRLRRIARGVSCERRLRRPRPPGDLLAGETARVTPGTCRPLVRAVQQL